MGERRFSIHDEGSSWQRGLPSWGKSPFGSMIGAGFARVNSSFQTGQPLSVLTKTDSGMH
jgi:hypothetical protein